ncbi:MAG: gamma-glutamylcyclotransferase [Gammaproteobacteria bacterium]|jgi:gamma-glutamylcyclotransferase|nr:gamma-glutamylcyclotransferase [Gammaproteobacteria bacterium]
MYYLAYGSNLHPLRLGARLGAIERIATVQLPGWRLAMHKRGEDGSGKGNLVTAADATAWGVVYRLDASLKSLLDEFEGEGYDCMTVQVDHQQQQLACFAYLAMPEWVDDDLLPHDWYAELIEHGAHHAGFPPAYLDWIARHPRSPDADGRQRHQQLLQQLRARNSGAVTAFPQAGCAALIQPTSLL